MLPRSYRLPALRIRSLLKQSKRFSLGPIVLYYTPATTSRFAIIVPTRVDKRAVVRNRAKRLIAESIRELLPKIKSPLEAVIMLRSRLSVDTIENVKKYVETLLKMSNA